MIDDSAKVYSAQLKRQTIDISEADPGEGPGGPAPLIFRPNRGPEAEFFYFCKELPGEKKFQHWKKLGKKSCSVVYQRFYKKTSFPTPPCLKSQMVRS